MSTDIRSTPPPGSLPERLEREFAIDMPPHVAATVSQRVSMAISSAPVRGARFIDRRRPSRRRIVLGIAVAAAIIAVAAAPVLKFFEGWGDDFDRLFALSTTVDQSVTDDGYRVTLVRAYGDPSSLRLGLTVEDLQDHGWAEIVVADATVTDDAGETYAASMGIFNGPTRTTGEGWLRYHVPAEAAHPGIRHLTVVVDRLGVRPDPAPTLPNGEIDLDHVSTTVSGTWAFDFDLEFQAAHTIDPNVSATVGDVTVDWNELTVTPAATVGRFTITGLRQVPWGWDPYFRIEHDGEEINLEMLDPGSVQSSDPGAIQDGFMFEAVPGFDDLSGTWTVTIDEFHRDIPDPNSDITTEEESIVGPWVVTFEGPPATVP